MKVANTNANNKLVPTKQVNRKKENKNKVVPNDAATRAVNMMADDMDAKLPEGSVGEQRNGQEAGIGL